MKQPGLLLLAVCLGCGGSSAAPSNGTIQITSPLDGAMVMPSPFHWVPIMFTVADFTLKAPGSCGGAANCGHVHVTVDGALCNDLTAPGPYNNDGFVSPIPIKLDKCPMISGMHTVTAELHNDNHTFYKNDAGNQVTSTITITAQ
jgi:hypothetical protein